MLKPFHGFALLSMGIAAACATIPVQGDPAVTVTAIAETVPVGTTNEDAADDPAIWRNPADPAASLIVGTDKKGGLYVYNLKGEQLSFLAAPGMNNVDLVELPDGRVVVAASDRSDLANAHIHLSLLDTQTGALRFEQRVKVGPGEGYGICFGAFEADGEVEIYSAPKNGTIYATRIMVGDPISMTREVAQVPSQPEGCIADLRTGTLYIGEENVGIWAIDLATGAKRMVAAIDNKMLVADVEGLAIAPEGNNGGYLVASSGSSS